MVYFWTYVHPLYCSSDLQARGFNSCGRSMHCRSNGYVQNSIFVRPTYFKLSLGQVIRSDGPFLQVGWALFVIQVGCAFFVGRMGIFRRSDAHFSQVGWALFVGNLDGRIFFLISIHNHVAAALGPLACASRSAAPEPVLAAALGPETLNIH